MNLRSALVAIVAALPSVLAFSGRLEVSVARWTALHETHDFCAYLQGPDRCLDGLSTLRERLTVDWAASTEETRCLQTVRDAYGTVMVPSDFCIVARPPERRWVVHTTRTFIESRTDVQIAELGLQIVLRDLGNSNLPDADKLFFLSEYFETPDDNDDEDDLPETPAHENRWEEPIRERRIGFGLGVGGNRTQAPGSSEVQSDVIVPATVRGFVRHIAERTRFRRNGESAPAIYRVAELEFGAGGGAMNRPLYDFRIEGSIGPRFGGVWAAIEARQYHRVRNEAARLGVPLVTLPALGSSGESVIFVRVSSGAAVIHQDDERATGAASVDIDLFVRFARFFTRIKGTADLGRDQSQFRTFHEIGFDQIGRVDRTSLWIRTELAWQGGDQNTHSRDMTSQLFFGTRF